MLYMDDATNVKKYVENGSVDLIIFDPPYGVGDTHLDLKSRKWEKSSEKWDKFQDINAQYSDYEQWLSLFLPLLKPSGSLCIFGSMHNIFLLGEILTRHLDCKIINTIVWNKVNAMFNITHSSLIEGTEYIIWSKQKNNSHYFNYDKSVELGAGKQLRNVWNGTTQEKEILRSGHPHQKPCWLISRLLNIACPKTGLVLDPMAGSGTTAVVCNYLKLNWVCIEKEQKYYEIARKRIEADTTYE